jgi:hypothetical protein
MIELRRLGLTGRQSNKLAEMLLRGRVASEGKASTQSAEPVCLSVFFRPDAISPFSSFSSAKVQKNNLKAGHRQLFDIVLPFPPVLRGRFTVRNGLAAFEKTPKAYLGVCRF